MDIKGAKALKQRLNSSRADNALHVVEPADIPADAPPVFHWTSKVPAEATPTEADECTSSPRSASLFRRLSLNPR